MNGRRMVAAGVVAGAVAVGGVAGAMIGIPGLSGATTDSGSSSTTAPGYEMPGGGRHGRGFFGLRNGSDGVFAAAAKALNLSTDELLEKLRDGETTIADVAEQQNVDVQTVIDAMEAVAAENIEELVNNPLPTPRFDFNGPGRGFGFGPPGRHESLDSAADALGITAAELRDALRDGKSIADVAEEHNVDLDTVVDALVKDATERIDQAVQDEKLTQDEADDLKADLRERITDRLNGEPPDFGKGRGGFGFRFRGGRGGHEWGGPGPGSPDEASPEAAAA